MLGHEKCSPAALQYDFRSLTHTSLTIFLCKSWPLTSHRFSLHQNVGSAAGRWRRVHTFRHVFPFLFSSLPCPTALPPGGARERSKRPAGLYSSPAPFPLPCAHSARQTTAGCRGTDTVRMHECTMIWICKMHRCKFHTPSLKTLPFKNMTAYLNMQYDWQEEIIFLGIFICSLSSLDLSWDCLVISQSSHLF